MPLQLFDTYTRQVRPFEPLNPELVGIYACGPTVYDFAHIGNLRTYLFEDILRRTLEYAGYNVKHVTNITDVGHLTSDADTGEDKMEKGSKRTGMTAWELENMAPSSESLIWQLALRCTRMAGTLSSLIMATLGSAASIFKLAECRPCQERQHFALPSPLL